MKRWSKINIKTYKEDPSDAEIPSHKLLIRSGMVKKLSSGIYVYGTLFLRSMRKLEKVIREELSAIDCQEISMPMVQPKSIWEESGRWGYGDLQTFKNKKNYEFCLGPTHEEVVTDYVRNDITSYKELPYNVFQIQTKYRDELRPRFGLMRAREFVMKDAYSFDEDETKAHESYKRFKQAYINIFDRLGLSYRVVQADAGAIGGSLTEEFQILADIGEDQLLVSDSSDYAANIEICPRVQTEPLSESLKQDQSLEEFDTPQLKTIEDLSNFLKIPSKDLVKTMFFKTFSKKEKKEETFVVLLRGDDEVNIAKIKNHLKLDEEPTLLNDEEVLSLTGAYPGSCGPVNLKKEVSIYADTFLNEATSIIVGANIDDKHLKGAKPGRDFQISAFHDFTLAKEGDPSPDGKGRLKKIRGIEAGHIFYLGTKYSQSMKAQFLDKNGKSQNFHMGCYGLGVTRTIQACIEQCNDGGGIVWPRSLTPFDVHICQLDFNDEINDYIEALSHKLEAKNISVFLDDRKERPGVKFKDADLIGFPVRLVLGKRGFSKGIVELKSRKESESREVSLDEATKEILTLLSID